MNKPSHHPMAKDFDPEVMRLFDQYVHGVIDRRGFLAGAGRLVARGCAWALPVLGTRVSLDHHANKVILAQRSAMLRS